MAEMTARLGRTETALAEARTQIETMRDPANDAELRRVRAELAGMQIAQSEREAELAQARSAVKKARERWTDQSRVALMRAEEAWRGEEAERLEAARREWARDARLGAATDTTLEGEASSATANRRRARYIALSGAVAAIVLLAVVFYPRPSTQPDAGTPAVDSARAAAAVLPGPKPSQAPASQTMVIVSSAKVRATPSSSSAVVTRLPRDTHVDLLERRGSWAHVRFGGDNGKPARDGWVSTTYLKTSETR
jgi:hypothetical protein